MPTNREPYWGLGQDLYLFFLWLRDITQGQARKMRSTPLPPSPAPAPSWLASAVSNVTGAVLDQLTDAAQTAAEYKRSRFQNKALFAHLDHTQVAFMSQLGQQVAARQPNTLAGTAVMSALWAALLW